MKLRVIAIYVVPLIVIILAGVAVLKIWQDKERETIRYAQTEVVTQANIFVSRELGHIQQIVQFMRAELERYPRSAYASDFEWQQAVANYLARAHSLSDYISQARWLSLEGRELVRVNIHNNEIRIVPSVELQDKSSRYYYLQGMKTDYDEVLLTPIDLNIEQGQIVTPYEVTLRAVAKLHNGDQEEMGLLVVNYNLNYLFARLRSLQNTQNTLEMVNDKGEWLLAHDPALEWLHLYGDITSSFSNSERLLWSQLERSANLSALQQSDGSPITSIPLQLSESTNAMPTYYLISKMQPQLWAKKQYALIFGILSMSVLLYSFTVALIVLVRKNVLQRQAFVQSIQVEKDRLEEAKVELQRTNHDLVRLQKELVEKGKMTSLGLMVSGVGHELNTPLGGIRLSLSSLEYIMKNIAPKIDDVNTLEAFNSSLNLATQNLERAINVVSQFKRITQHQMHSDPELFDVGNMLEDTLAPLTSVLKKYPKIKVVCVSEPGEELRAAQGTVSQVIQNLLLNALEHAFAANQSGTIRIVAKQEDDFVIEVSDTGKGIDENVLPHIWEPFVTTGRGDHHTGLGLYMVHQWVTRLLNGRIEAANTDQGARFTITLPILPEPPQTILTNQSPHLLASLLQPKSK